MYEQTILTTLGLCHKEELQSTAWQKPYNNQIAKKTAKYYALLTQMSMKEDIKRFGDKGNNALLEELNQLHEWQVLLPTKKEEMSYDDRKRSHR